VKLLVVGANGAVGKALEGLLSERKLEYRALSTQAINFLHKAEVVKAVSLYAPTQIINVASYINLELAEHDVDAARQCDEQNSLIPATLAEVCVRLSLPLIQHSSSFVFDGQKAHPYSEDDPVNPVCRYGRSKWYGERSIRDTLPQHIIVRTDWVFSEQDRPYFQRHIDACKAGNGKLEIISNRFSPTPAADVARVLFGVAQQVDCAADVWGTYHYCAQQPLAQELFVEQVLQEAAKYDQELAAMMGSLRITRLPVQLPYIANTVLNSQKLFETFGIKPRMRNTELAALIRQLYAGQQESRQMEPSAVQSAASDATPPADAELAVKRKPRSGRRPSKKGAKRKA